MEAVLRVAVMEGGLCAGNLRTRLQGGDEAVGDGHEGIHPPVLMILHLQLKAVGGTVAANHGLCERHDLGLADVGHAAVDLGHDTFEVIALAAPLVPVLQAQQEHAVVGALSGHAAHAHALGVCLDLRQVGDELLDTVHHAVCLALGAARLGLHGDVDDTHVLVGHQCRLGGGEEIEEGGEGSGN